MKNRRWIGLAALLGVSLAVSQPALRAQGNYEAPMPDLTILKVAESGTTAHVSIRNIGSANTAKTFMVRAFEWKNGAWYGCGYKWVNGLAVGTTLDVSITAPGIGNYHNKYVVDSNGYVTESNEANNVYYKFGS